MAPRRSAAAEAEEQEQDERAATLQFNEPLTWRPGKPIPIDTLLKRLDRLTKELAEMDQETTDPSSLTKVAKEVASHQLLNHKDKGVRAYTACCVVDILRLCAPDAPFTPSQLKVRTRPNRIGRVAMAHLSLGRLQPYRHLHHPLPLRPLEFLQQPAQVRSALSGRD